MAKKNTFRVSNPFKGRFSVFRRETKTIVIVTSLASIFIPLKGCNLSELLFSFVIFELLFPNGRKYCLLYIVDSLQTTVLSTLLGKTFFACHFILNEIILF